MPQAYSDDLRRKLLEAYEAGAGSLRELATRFRVSWGYTKKIRGQQLRTGQKERPVQSQHGPASRVTAAVATAVARRRAPAARCDAAGVAAAGAARRWGVAQQIAAVAVVAAAGAAA